MSDTFNNNYDTQLIPFTKLNGPQKLNRDAEKTNLRISYELLHSFTPNS